MVIELWSRIPPPESVGTVELKDGAVTEAKLANLSVTTAKLADLAVTATKLANEAVIEAKIAPLAVTSGKLADLAVITGKIADLAVTAAKIASGAVTEPKIADLAVTTAKIADTAVTLAKVTDDVRVHHILGDNTEVTETAITYTDKKRFNFYKHTTIPMLNWKTIEIVCEGKVAATGQALDVGFFVGVEVAPRLVLTYTETVYTTKRGVFSIADLPTGLHLITIKMKVAASGQTGYQRHLETMAVLT